MDSRQHRRVRMRLPVRLRWTAPLGQRVEPGETMDVSRSGLLVSTGEPHAPGVSLWVTFPYDSSPGDGQPEVLACVIRCQEIPEIIRPATAREKIQSPSVSEWERSAKPAQRVRAPGVRERPSTFALALHFEGHSRAASNGNSHRRDPERRGSPRHSLAVPVRVRPEGIPWFEEAMTLDFSSKGMRFRSQREYQPGESLKIAFEESALTPWSGSGEFCSKVVRVESSPGSSALDISVCRVD
ncbi:MAG TPA: PilZ domain-containing protein [Candidatus Acidoferrum sp.]|nr:PilZ domain-containing protein [Candidatus Acidoferrum sp.]